MTPDTSHRTQANIHIIHYSFPQICAVDTIVRCCLQAFHQSLETLDYIRYNLQTGHNTLPHYSKENGCDDNRHQIIRNVDKH
jgi:hypothetical protein